MAQKGTPSQQARRKRGVAMIVAGTPVTEVARKMNVSRRTASRWAKQAEAEIKAAAEKEAETNQDKLQRLVSTAFDRAFELLDSDDDRVKADMVKTLLSRGGFPEGSRVEADVNTNVQAAVVFYPNNDRVPEPSTSDDGDG